MSTCRSSLELHRSRRSGSEQGFTHDSRLCGLRERPENHVMRLSLRQHRRVKVRRRDLRLYLLHPGDGGYWCLTLAEGSISETRALWNLHGSALWLSSHRPECDITIRWPHFLSSQWSAVKVLEDLLGLDNQPGEPRPASLSVAVLAELAARLRPERHLAARAVECGVQSSSHRFYRKLRGKTLFLQKQMKTSHSKQMSCFYFNGFSYWFAAGRGQCCTMEQA